MGIFCLVSLSLYIITSLATPIAQNTPAQDKCYAGADDPAQIVPDQTCWQTIDMDNYLALWQTRSMASCASKGWTFENCFFRWAATQETVEAGNEPLDCLLDGNCPPGAPKSVPTWGNNWLLKYSIWFFRDYMEHLKAYAKQWLVGYKSGSGAQDVGYQILAAFSKHLDGDTPWSQDEMLHASDKLVAQLLSNLPAEIAYLPLEDAVENILNTTLTTLDNGDFAKFAAGGALVHSQLPPL